MALKFSMILEAVDRVTAPARKMRSSVSQLTSGIRRWGQDVRRVSQDIESGSRSLEHYERRARRLRQVAIGSIFRAAGLQARRFQDYGITSHPHPGAEAVVVCAGGLRSHAIAIRVDDRAYRLTGLQQGEVALYDDLGNVVKLGRDGIEITGAAQVKVTAPKVIVESDDVSIGAEGGKPVARVDDLVDLSTGKIISGSEKVTAA